MYAPTKWDGSRGPATATVGGEGEGEGLQMENCAEK